jgi:4-hydroxybenzoate polyprenyltransferase
MQPLAATAPFPRRFAAYIGERFPLPAHLPLIALFFLSATQVALAIHGGSGRIPWVALAVLVLAFFHLRIFDELKDYEEDRVAHPERLLSRGVIRLNELEVAGGVAVVVEVLLAATLGAAALGAWALAFGFSVVMRFEFGAASFLRGRPVLYALVHNPVVALLAAFCGVAATQALHRDFGWYVATVSAAAFVYELGRKSARYEDSAGRYGFEVLWVGAQLATVGFLAVVLLHLPLGGRVPLVTCVSLAPLVVAAWMRNRREAAGASFLVTTLAVAALGSVLRGLP